MARIGEALVALLVGALLAPVGALIGSALFVAAGLLLGRNPDGPYLFIGMTFYGTIAGLILGAPIAVAVLPIIYGVMRWRSAVSVRRLTIAGAACGALSVAIASVALWWISYSGGTDFRFWLFMLGPAVDATLVGALCANWFAGMMRSFRPEGWPSALGKSAA